jgi:hypothetical protein
MTALYAGVIPSRKIASDNLLKALCQYHTRRTACQKENPLCDHFTEEHRWASKRCTTILSNNHNNHFYVMYNVSRIIETASAIGDYYG